MTTELERLHLTWNQITGQDLNARATERLFFEFWKLDFTTDDLQCVLKYMLSFNRKHPDCPMKIQAHKVLGDLEIFASVLAEARARERNRVKPRSNQDSVLQSFRPRVDAELGSNGKPHRITDFIKLPP